MPRNHCGKCGHCDKEFMECALHGMPVDERFTCSDFFFEEQLYDRRFPLF